MARQDIIDKLTSINEQINSLRDLSSQLIDMSRDFNSQALETEVLREIKWFIKDDRTLWCLNFLDALKTIKDRLCIHEDKGSVSIGPHTFYWNIHEKRILIDFDDASSMREFVQDRQLYVSGSSIKKDRERMLKQINDLDYLVKVSSE